MRMAPGTHHTIRLQAGSYVTFNLLKTFSFNLQP
jgi:hypothetical protein